ncbi:OmpA/MotB family protein [Reinekea blandensis]|uniref:OmpA/MotB n=1 Tax=Reinekea blandensis MED297 TaxID=314283 RepID=A4BEH1_9GAMM|nr:OmpA family protein [Reinekea blandensis]EAR09398.1 OmpA/MotB [Reinekea sp. MED297] [Reinekea blandensis MED297]
MTRISAPQALIFSISTLIVSLLVNILLYQSHNDKNAELAEQAQTITELNDQLTQQRQLKSTQFARLDEMTGQQTELASIIQQLQGELKTLSQQQQSSAETARQAQQQLATARSRIQTLDQELKTAQQSLEQARVTIHNQQRALRQTSATQASVSTELSTELAAQLSSYDRDISITTAADGTTLINIPLTLLFANTNLDLANDAETVLTSLSEVLKQHPDRRVQVIGHADARPIVSDLAQTYPTNWELSSARASRVVTFLIDQGVSDHRLLASGRAANQPVRDGANEEDWSVNRRIEVQIQ